MSTDPNLSEAPEVTRLREAAEAMRVADDNLSAYLRSSTPRAPSATRPQKLAYAADVAHRELAAAQDAYDAARQAQ